ncbi:SAC3 domain-containing protein 1-like isoform X2 [Anneissia japonica]|nr:SAC3 domain-containing protein 1-like isoform X2 [Anneissia japonica]
MVKGTENTKRPKADPESTVKEYSRPAAGKKALVLSDLRPPEVLYITWSYLVESIANKTDVGYLTVYNFIFDRLRSIRQDAVIQRSEGPEIVAILEQAVRFLLASSYRLCREDMMNFDTKICFDHLSECLNRLLVFYHFYPDFAKNQVEFQSLHMLCNLGSSQAVLHILGLPFHLRNHKRIKLALQLNSAYLENNFVKFTRLSEQCNYIESCILHRYRTSFLISSLAVMNVAYHSKALTFPSCVLSEWLGFDSTQEASAFCKECGLTIKSDSVCFIKGSLKPQSKMAHKRTLCHKLVDSKLKKNMSMSDIIKGFGYERKERSEKPMQDMWDYVD